MKFNKSEKLRIRQALQIAIDSEYDFIGAHKTGLKFVNGNTREFFPKEYKNIIAQTRRTIKSFEKILNKLNNESIIN